MALVPLTSALQMNLRTSSVQPRAAVQAVASWYDSGARLTADEPVPSGPTMVTGSSWGLVPLAPKLGFSPHSKAGNKALNTAREAWVPPPGFKPPKFEWVKSWYDAGARLEAAASSGSGAEALQAEGAAVVERRASMQGMYDEKAKILALKKEGAATVARREEMADAAPEVADVATAADLDDLMARATAAAEEASAALAAAGDAEDELEAALMDEEKAVEDAVTTATLLQVESLAEEAATGDALLEAVEAAQAAMAEAAETTSAALAEAVEADEELGGALEEEEKALEEAVSAMTEVVDAELGETTAKVDKDAQDMIERAEARVAARAELRATPAAPPPAPAPAAAAPPAPATGRAPPIAPPPAALVKSTLPPALATTLDGAGLYDPTTFKEDEKEGALGAVGFGALLFFLLPIFEAGLISDAIFSLLVGGGIGGYLSLRKDAVGAVTRDVVGDTSSKAAKGTVEKVWELEEEFDISNNLKKGASQVVKDLQKKVKEGL